MLVEIEKWACVSDAVAFFYGQGYAVTKEYVGKKSATTYTIMNRNHADGAHEINIRHNKMSGDVTSYSPF